MRVLDVIQGNVTVRAAEDRDRFRSAFNTVRDENRPRNDQDTLSLNSVMESDLVRIQELQKNYVKNETSLRGLEEMQRRISGFESEPAEQRDYRGSRRPASGRRPGDPVRGRERYQLPEHESDRR